MSVPASKKTDAAPARSFTFIRDADVKPVTPKELFIEINGERFDLIPKISSIDLVTFAAMSMQGGSNALISLHEMFKTIVAETSYDEFIKTLRTLDLQPTEIAELAQDMISIYTARPTEPS